MVIWKCSGVRPEVTPVVLQNKKCLVYTGMGVAMATHYTVEVVWALMTSPACSLNISTERFEMSF